MNSTSSSGSAALICCAGVGHDFVDAAAAVVLEHDGEVAGVGFGDGGEAHLEAGAARGGGDFGDGVEDLVDVEEDAVGLLEGGTGGHDVVEDEAAFIHFGEEVGAEAFVSEEDADDEKAAGSGEPERLGESEAEDALVEAEDGAP